MDRTGRGGARRGGLARGPARGDRRRDRAGPRVPDALWRPVRGGGGLLELARGLAPGLIATGDERHPELLEIAGDWAGASERWQELDCPYEAAVARLGSDDPELLGRSLNELQALGARPAAAIVSRQLRERGVRSIPRGPRTRTRQNPAGLTARELEVLDLLCDGLRNAEIAQRLVISQKTVDHHVSAILRKLGAHTRGEASALAVELGLGGRS